MNNRDDDRVSWCARRRVLSRNGSEGAGGTGRASGETGRLRSAAWTATARWPQASGRGTDLDGMALDAPGEAEGSTEDRSSTFRTLKKVSFSTAHDGNPL